MILDAGGHYRPAQGCSQGTLLAIIKMDFALIFCSLFISFFHMIPHPLSTGYSVSGCWLWGIRWGRGQLGSQDLSTIDVKPFKVI